MASRRSHAASHNITSISTRYKITYYSRVPRGHVYIRNPLQAAKQRSCGISIPSPPLGSAKRDRLSSSTIYGKHKSPFRELIFWAYVPTACSGFHYKGPAPRNPQLILNLLAFVGAGLRRDAIASYVCYGSLWLSSNKSQFAFVVLSPLRYENLFFMSSCQKYTFFMSKIPVLHVFMSKIHVFLSAMQISYKE